MSRGGREKPAATLAFKRGGRAIVPKMPATPAIIPEPPDEVGQYGRAAWQEFWETPISGLVNMKRDGERLRHWCRCVDDRAKLRNVYRLAFDSKVWRQIKDMSTEIERAEAVFGMNPRDAMRLTGALDVAEKAESSIKARRGRTPVEA